MRLGIGTYSFMWSIGFPGARPTHAMDAFALLACAVELGVGVVQFGPNLPLARLDSSELSRIVEQARVSNISIEYGTRGLELTHLRKEIAFARVLSSTLLRTIPDFAVENMPTISDLAGQLKSILPNLEKNGVRLAIENGNIPADEMAELIKKINSPWVGITLDTANSLEIPEGTRQVVEALAPYTFSFHVKDFVVRRAWHRMGFVVEGRPAGRGQMDVQWILQRLNAAGANPNAILELWPPEQMQLESTIALEHAWAKESVQYLRKYLPN